MCNGQTLPINQNQALFSLLGTTYGGNGQTTFALPDLRGRVPMHEGSGFTLGEGGGEVFHTLTQSEMPSHTHNVTATSDVASKTTATGNLWAKSDAAPFETSSNASMNPASISTVGGSQPHENRAPYLTLNYCIALQGIFPSQT